jgi:hypothetical protein
MHGIVVFIVGKKKHKLQMPRRIVCESSEWIDAKCKDHPNIDVLVEKFPDVSVEIFTLLQTNSAS